MTTSPPLTPEPIGTAPPVDAAARERLVEELDRTFFVEAGAGTGKTKSLVDRIVNLLAHGRVTIDRVAAITFTEAAASELRDRVREGLERAANERAAETEAARCRQGAGEIDLAAIQTIHAFAGTLLRTYPLEAGLPPSFRTMDDVEQSLRFEERFAAWFRGPALRSPAREALKRAFVLGMNEGHLHDLAMHLERQYDLLGPAASWSTPSASPALPVAHRVGRDLAELVDLLDYAKNGEDDPLVRVVRATQPGARRLLAATTEDGALAALVALGTLKRPGNMKDWRTLSSGENACRAIKGTLGEVNDAVADALVVARAATFAAVLGILREFVLGGVDERKREGVAAFQDLLVWARDLLRDHPGVRRRAQDRYRRLFVDEFQDTDPLQAEIAFYLAGVPGAPLPADWREIALEDGRLFVVGDPKQSIYRFRRADVAVYDDLLRRLDEAREHLVQNFRSVGRVIDWVNHHFVEEMRELAGVQPRYVALAARRDGVGDDPGGVYLVGQPIDGGAESVADAESEALAVLARRAVDDGWLVSDRAPDGEPIARPARFRDVCILTPSRTRLRQLEEALDRADVPYRLESGKLILATQEVRDLLAGLRAVDDPSDQVALIGALRSPAFGCSDANILRWVEGGGRLSHEHPESGPDGPVKAALTWLASLSARRHELSPPALVEAYVHERLLELVAIEERRPREAWRRLRYVVDRARIFTGAGRHSLRAFLDWIDGLAQADVRDGEGAAAEQDEDAVRIMTVHQAKGLEFPIVLLRGLGSERRGRPTSVEAIADRAREVLECRVGEEWRTPGFEAVKSREKTMEEAEAVRLLYVAGTRARDHLVLSVFRSMKARPCPAEVIERRLTGAEGLCARLDVDLWAAWQAAPGNDSTDNQGSLAGSPHDSANSADGQRGRGAAPNVGAWGDAGSEAAWVARRAEAVARLAAPPMLEFGASMRETDWLVGDEDAGKGDGLGTDAGDVPREVRRLVRRARTNVAALDALVDAGDLADADPTALEYSRAILASPAYQAARAEPTCRRDVPLLAMADGLLVDVVVDLVYRTPEGAVLVQIDVDGPRGADGEPRDGPGAESDDALRQAGDLVRAFLAATGQLPAAVELIHAASGRVSHFQGCDDPVDRVAPATRPE